MRPAFQARAAGATCECLLTKQLGRWVENGVLGSAMPFNHPIASVDSKPHIAFFAGRLWSLTAKHRKECAGGRTCAESGLRSRR